MTDEDAYRRQIVRLTKERNAARCECDEVREKFRREVAELRGQVREGTSARVQALVHELTKVRAERDELKRKLRNAMRG
jgi:hypothetical protein